MSGNHTGVLNQDMADALHGVKRERVAFPKSEKPGERARRERAELAQRAEAAGVTAEEQLKAEQEADRRRRHDRRLGPVDHGESLTERVSRMNRERFEQEEAERRAARERMDPNRPVQRIGWDGRPLEE